MIKLILNRVQTIYLSDEDFLQKTDKDTSMKHVKFRNFVQHVG